MDVQGNVLLIGSEGVGKSTLVRAVLGGGATARYEGAAGAVCVHESEDSPFRIIEARGLGDSFLSRRSAIRAIRRWSRATALDGIEENDVHVIWFCVEGKSRKLIRQQLRQLSRATDVWRSVPIIVVITKSYAASERDGNIEMVRAACGRRRRLARCLSDIVCVVAAPWAPNEVSFVPPSGILELIEATKRALPLGTQAASADIAAFEWRRRRSVARRIVGAAAIAAAGVGAAPLPIADALILTPIETSMVCSLAKLYGIDEQNSMTKLVTCILEAGTVGTAAKAAISALKAIPGVNLATGVLNAAIAATIVSTMGEATTRALEHIARGEHAATDTAWLHEFLESELARNLVSHGTKLLGDIGDQKGSSAQKEQLLTTLRGLLASGKTAA